MAKNVNGQRKEELIASLNQKRENIAQKTGSLQQAVAPGKSVTLDSAAGAEVKPKMARSAGAKVSAIPLLGKAMGLGNSFSLPSDFIRKESVKPVLIGLGASFVILTLLKSGKRKKKRKAEKVASMEAVTKPAVGFLLLKTALSVTQPALKQIVKNSIAKRR